MKSTSFLVVTPDILTRSGIYFNLIDVGQNQVIVEDIAHALSNICRFAGHTSEFYSVAQHSVMSSFLVDPEDALAALFHDSSEAYIGDVTSPLKQLLPDYKAVEARIHADIFEKLGLPVELPPSVKKADRILLATEKRDLMPWDRNIWSCTEGYEPLPEKIIPLPPKQAAEAFLKRYRDLRG